MIKPSIHLNGTSHTNLREPYAEAYRALRLAEEALMHTRPHPRDYYPQGEEAITTALHEHEQRLRLIKKLLDDMRELRMHCNAPRRDVQQP